MGRGGGWKDKMTKGLAWGSYILGVVAASLLASTFIGGLIDGAFGLLPGWFGMDEWLAPVVLLALFTFVLIDLLKDGVPNRVALYCTLAMPSVARSVNGDLGNNVEQWAGSVRESLQGDLNALLGTGSAVGLALGAGLCAWIVARRTMAAKAAGG